MMNNAYEHLLLEVLLDRLINSHHYLLHIIVRYILFFLFLQVPYRQQ
jgi:hypothetical protein